jgi:hypothetical protein
MERPVKMKEARDRFFEKNGIDLESYTARRFRVPLGPITLVFPDPGQLPLHDLHHVVLDVPPTFWGELEVSALELRAGPANALIWLLCVGTLALGAVIGPRRTWRAWKRYRSCGSLYGRNYTEVLEQDLDAVKRSIGLQMT